MQTQIKLIQLINRRPAKQKLVLGHCCDSQDMSLHCFVVNTDTDNFIFVLSEILIDKLVYNFALKACFDVKLMLSVLPKYSNTSLLFSMRTELFSLKKYVFCISSRNTINIGRVKKHYF